MNTSSDPVVIVGYARTPMGGFMGSLSALTAAELGAAATRAALERSGLAAAEVEQVLFGCVLQAGQGQAPARQVALGAGLSQDSGAITINKMCGSGMVAMMLARDMLVAGSADLVVAGGTESMSNAPYLLPKARAGYRMGHGQVIDHMFLDGLEDAYDRGRLMGTFAEDCATTMGFTREAQDDFALASLSRALAATADGGFADEIVPVSVTTRKGEEIVATDEQPANARPDRISSLKPAFRPGGTVTAANSSSISDGAAALVMVRLSEAKRRGLTPLARIVGQASHGERPNLFPIAPVGATRKLLDRVGWTVGEVDLFEVNEAFAVVTLAAMQELGLPHEKVNVHGGACALGHPIGASGARIVVTLLAALRRRGLKRGVASICIGGGEATAVAIEVM